MWVNDSAMKITAPMTWITFACCIVSRSWSKFGNSMISPVTLMITPSSTTPIQNQPFSPKLNRPEGTSSPLNRPPALAIHWASLECQKLSLTNTMIVSSRLRMKNGPTKLCRFLASAD